MSKPVATKLITASAVLLLMAAGSYRVEAQKNVVQPGDAIIASSSNSPGSEGVANAIDGTQTKYLNFDLDNDATGGPKPAGFVVTPSVGATRVTAMALLSANDAQDRDPKVVTLEGSNDDTIASFTEGKWEMIATISDIPSWPSVFGDTDNRYKTQILEFNNLKAYKHYRWTVTMTQGPSTCCLQIAEVQLLGSVLPGDVTVPGDVLIPSSSNSPGSEGVANAIDGTQTKYLNFDLDSDATGGPKPAGFVVTPSLGRTVVTGMTLQSANDAQDRDPKSIRLEGSNDATIADFTSGNWEVITTITDIPSWPSVFGPTDAEHRFKTQTFLFDNPKPYTHYRWTVLTTQGPSTCCLQIAEVELLGTGAPKDVTQPGDPIIASSSNSPGSEGVANAIDGTQTKYLNFDLDNDATGGPKPAGFVVTPSIGETTVIGMSMLSANDAADRDPKVVKLEGSNDATIASFSEGNWELITQLNVPAWTEVFGTDNRFKLQEFFFNNSKAYKHYRWTVLETQGPSTCCLQIAEVELLAAATGADCNKARFVLQPTDVPVLQGSLATFVSVVNGPWPVQWYRNGQPIPGANQVTYTTEAVTTANATNVYSVEIVGCEMSAEVQAVIFKPSATKSIGISFRGGGANGAPTEMNADDIAGVHPQAYWVNAPDAGTGSLPFDTGTTDEAGNPVMIEVVNSDNQPSDVIVEWTTSGTWGSGTGEGTPTQRLLNGLVYDNPGGEPANVTFYNVPAGTHAVIAYLVGIPLQFQNSDYTVVGQSSQTINVRVLNSDEYNAAPGFYRGISTDPSNRSLASYIRFDNVRAAADGTVRLEWNCLTTGFDRGTPVAAVQLLFNATAPGAPPVITAQPQPTVAAEGGTARLTVGATGDGLTYQWLKNGRALPNGGNVSGATSSILTIKEFSEADEAVYSVAIFNPGGSTISGTAAARISKFDIKDALSGYWTFDPTSGTTVPNDVAGGRAGTVTGPATWGAGKVANALSFDGATTYVVVDDYPKATKGIGASVWVKADPNLSTDAVIVRNARGVFDVGSDSNPLPTSQFELWLDFDDATGTARATASIRVGPNIISAVAPSAFTLGTWQHVAFSGDGAQLRLYINGVQVDVIDYIGHIEPSEIPFLSIGARLALDAETSALGPDAAAPNFFIGQIDDLALWGRGLTADEVAKIYAAGQAGKKVTTVEITPPVVGDGTYKIGLNFGTDQPASTLAATDVAGAEDAAQANWNNLAGQSGSMDNIVAQADGTAPETTTAAVVWASNNTWASTGGGEENNLFTGANKTLMTGYLDTLESSTTTVTITNLPAALTADGYDVYIYMLGGVANKGGGYRVLDAASGAVLKDFIRVQAPANPTAHVEAPTADPTSTNNIGTYLVFTGLSASAITVEASTANGLGFGSTAFRAPMNAIQLVAPSSAPAGPPITIAVNAEGNVVITFEGTLQSADAVTGPYTNVAGATSPFTTAPTGTKFYRAVEQ